MVSYSRSSWKKKAPSGRAVIVKRKRRTNYSSLKLSKPMKTLVDRRIHSNIETKQTVHQINADAIGAPSPVAMLPVLSTNGLFRVLPSIAQGDTRADRQGSQIKVRSCRVTGYVLLPARDVGTQDDRSMIQLRFICASAKNRLSYESLDQDPQAVLTNIVRKGNTTHGIMGDFETIDLPLNTALVTKHYDRHFILKSLGNNAVNGQLNNCYKFSFSIPMKNKVFKYANPTDTFPKNSAPFICAGWNYLNNAAPTPVAVPKIFFQTLFSYEDA